MSAPTLSNRGSCANPLDKPIAAPNYPADAPLYRDPATGWCYPLNDDGTPERYAQYGYDPALGTGIVFTILFAVLMIAHLVINILSRRSWLIVITIGALGETIGWIGRAISGSDNGWTNLAANAFLIQICCLTIAPVFFSGALYGLQVLVAHVHPASSPIAPKKLAWGFVMADVLCLVLQGSGGGIASTADTQAQQDSGTHLMLAGIVIQFVILLVFSAIGVSMILRARGHPLETPVHGLKLRRLAIGMIIADLALLVRGIYRTIELAQGWRGKVITTEGYFLGLDAVMMLICLIALAWGHPLFTLPKPNRSNDSHEMSRLSSKTGSPGVQSKAEPATQELSYA